MTNDSRAVTIARPLTGIAASTAVQIAPAQIEIGTLAETFVKSRLFKDVGDIHQAVVKLLYGQELGLSPMQSMLGIYTVEGKPSPSAATMAAVIKRSGRYLVRTVRHTDQLCTLEFLERLGGRWESVGLSEFTIGDAQRAGLASKSTWKQYPKAMLWARALSQGARWYCAEVFGGPVYTPEELGAEVGEEGDVIGLPPLPDVAALEGQIAEVAQARPADKPPFEPDKPIRDDQRRAIHACGAQRGQDHDAIHQIAIERFGVRSMKDLTQAQAKDLYSVVEAMPLLPPVESECEQAGFA